MRKEYTLTDEEVESLRIAQVGTDTEVLNWVTTGKDPMFECIKRVNAKWIEIGKSHGFDGMTARPANSNYSDLKHIVAEAYDA